ncbi:response regulator [Candidatus Peregrinibacteria bacterium]|nr:response regulator [Candidatus Peregrinibacteria bacterium]
MAEKKKSTAAPGAKDAPKAVAKKGKKILIVEDEHPLAHALAGDGEAGLKLANAETFHMVLLDLIMPKVDGFGFLEGLKKKTPVIVLSNLG